MIRSSSVRPVGSAAWAVMRTAAIAGILICGMFCKVLARTPGEVFSFEAGARREHVLRVPAVLSNVAGVDCCECATVDN